MSIANYITDATHAALRLADALIENADLDSAEGGNPAVCKLEWDAAAELRRLHAVNAELVKAAADAEHVIEILWVSHHASRADAVLEALRAAIAKATGER